MADDHAPPPRPDFNLGTPEGLSAYAIDLAERTGIPERLRYPETPEAMQAALAEARADPRTIPGERVRVWARSLGTADPLPPPDPE